MQTGVRGKLGKRNGIGLTYVPLKFNIYNKNGLIMDGGADNRSIVGGQIEINRSMLSLLRRLDLRVRRVNGRMMKRKEVWPV